MGKLRRLFSRGLAVAAGIAMAAVVAEAMLRAVGYSPTVVDPLRGFHEGHPLVGYRGRPNFSAVFRRPEFEVVIAHDENGFRKQEFQNPLGASRRRVFVFGDSFTWGWGVGQGKVFTDRMSRLMPGYHVMNFGLNASGTVEQFTLFEVYAKDLIRPGDTVVVLFVGNDFKDNTTGVLRGEVTAGGVRRVGPTRLLGAAKDTDSRPISYLANYVKFAAQVFTAAWQEKWANQRAPRLVALGGPSPEMVVTTYFLREFQKASAEKQGRFIAAYAPQQGELGETENLSERAAQKEKAYRRAFFACAEAAGARALDLLPHFLAAKKIDRTGRFTFQRDKHWNEHGHAVAAKTLADFILALDGER